MALMTNGQGYYTNNKRNTLRNQKPVFCVALENNNDDRERGTFQNMEGNFVHLKTSPSVPHAPAPVLPQVSPHLTIIILLATEHRHANTEHSLISPTCTSTLFLSP